MVRKNIFSAWPTLLLNIHWQRVRHQDRWGQTDADGSWHEGKDGWKAWTPGDGEKKDLDILDFQQDLIKLTNQLVELKGQMKTKTSTFLPPPNNSRKTIVWRCSKRLTTSSSKLSRHCCGNNIKSNSETEAQRRNNNSGGSSSTRVQISRPTLKAVHLGQSCQPTTITRPYLNLVGLSKNQDGSSCSSKLWKTS